MTSSSLKKNIFATDLLQLQNKIKRDPSSYKDEFLQAFHNYESQLDIYLMRPTKPNKQLADSILFLANITHCYKDDLCTYPKQLCDILKKYSNVLHTDMRMAICRALILIRNKQLIEAIDIFEMFFYLIKSTSDKSLRKLLYQHLLNDVKRMKLKLKSHKQCSQVQQYVFGLTNDSNVNVAKYALNLLIDLYKKQIWNDAKTVNVISSSCFSRVTKVLVVALKFFSSKTDDDAQTSSDSDSDDDEKASQTQILLALRVAKKTQKRKKRTDRALKSLKKEKKSKKVENYRFSALNLLYDPQDFAEKLFKEAEKTNESFEIKLMMLDLIARLIGIHGLYLLNFYAFLIRFLTPHQREVAKMLWFAAIASHELVPPDAIEQMLMTIANNFITERNTSEVIAIGLNAIREICSRCPLAMNEDLLGDLIQYKTYKDKGVSTAAKSLIHLFRMKNPQLLHRKERGRPTDATRELKVLKYGEVDVKSYIPGAELIKIEEAPNKNEVNDEEWEECSDTSEDQNDDDDGWIDVRHSSDEDETNVKNTEIDPEISKLNENEKELKAIEASTQRIFTQEDFKRIKQEQLRKTIEYTSANSNKRKTISIDESDEEDAKGNGILPLSSITYVNKKQRRDKESRVASIMEGRKDRGKFGQRIKDSKLGKTNKEKQKTKSFMMLRHKINRKHKRSFKDKQVALRNSLLKQKKMK